jgi:hypothetical protein
MPIFKLCDPNTQPDDENDQCENQDNFHASPRNDQ